LASEQRCAEQVDRIAALSARSTDLLGQVSTLRRDLAAARAAAGGFVVKVVVAHPIWDH
jgi:hypothetical protein